MELIINGCIYSKTIIIHGHTEDKDRTPYQREAFASIRRDTYITHGIKEVHDPSQDNIFDCTYI